MSFLADLLSTFFDRRYRGVREADQAGRSIEALSTDLLGSSGEVSGALLARHIFDRYAGMTLEEKHAFFNFMTHDLEIQPDLVRSTLAAYEASPGRSTYRAFMAACEPPRQELARRLNQVSGATGQLVDMRRDLLALIKEHPDLAPLDQDLQHLFASWFNRGFLVLRPINWQSPADILEKIIAYEAVHAIDSWDDLRRRLRPADRRCFGFFHPSMPSEPLIFVEVALTRGVPNSIQTLLADERQAIQPEEADTAVFYSISNCQSGLAGISFGNSLIKTVVSDLSRALPGLSTFVTLSPIPGLSRWAGEAGYSLGEGESNAELAAHYLLTAKRGDGLPYDPVARFHLGNGALIHAVHEMADTSDKGISQSGGTMVNYLYNLKRISQNHERFVGKKEVIASPAVRSLAGNIRSKAA